MERRLKRTKVQREALVDVARSIRGLVSGAGRESDRLAAGLRILNHILDRLVPGEDAYHELLELRQDVRHGWIDVLRKEQAIGLFSTAKHVRRGNCWLAHSDICMEHEQPRGECSKCPRCHICDSVMA